MNEKIVFYDIYDYIHIPFWKTKFFISCTIIFTIIALAIVAYFLIKFLKNKYREKKIVPLWEKTIGELQKLTPTKYETKEEFKTFYFTITKIIKKYIFERFSINLLEKTDVETIEYLKGALPPTEAQPPAIDHKIIDLDFIDRLEKIFQGSLFIKFANAQALKEQALKDLNIIIALVEKTVPDSKNKLPG
jgi:hypothetical protein